MLLISKIVPANTAHTKCLQWASSESSLCVDACCAKSMFIEFEIFLIHGLLKENILYFFFRKKRQRYHNSPFMLAYVCFFSACWFKTFLLSCKFALPLSLPLARILFYEMQTHKKWEVINLCKNEHFSFLFHFICLISLRLFLLHILLTCCIN